MDTPHLMVYAQKIEKDKPTKKSSERIGLKHLIVAALMKSWMNIVALSFEKRFSVQCFSNARTRFNEKILSNPTPQGGNGYMSQVTLVLNVEGNMWEISSGLQVYFGFVQMIPKIRDCPLFSKNEGDNNGRAQPYPLSNHSGSGSNAPKRLSIMF